MRFETFGPDLHSGEFWYTDDASWERWLDRIGDAISEHDPWGLLVYRPDTDAVIVDVLHGWGDRVRNWNGRRVLLVRPALEDLP